MDRKKVIAALIVATVGCSLQAVDPETGNTEESLTGSGSVSAPVYITGISASGHTLTVYDGVYGKIGTLQLDPSVTATGSFNSAPYLIDTVKVSGTSIQFRNSHGTYFSIALSAPGLQLALSGKISGYAYLKGMSSTSAGLQFVDSASVMTSVAVTEAHQCRALWTTSAVARFTGTSCSDFAAIVTATADMCVAQLTAGDDAQLVTAAESDASARCQQWCQQFGCYSYTFLPQHKCEGNVNGANAFDNPTQCATGCTLDDWCRVNIAQNVDNCICRSPDGGSSDASAE